MIRIQKNCPDVHIEIIPVDGADVYRVKAEYAEGNTEEKNTAEDGQKTGGFPADCAVRLNLEVSGKAAAYMANVLYTPHWCRPEFGTDFTAVPKDTQALLWQNEEGEYGYILPMCGGGYVCSLEGTEYGLSAVIRSNCQGLRLCDTFAFAVGSGTDPYELMRRCARAAAEKSGGIRMREERNYPPVFEYLGWCSWDAMEIWVNEEEIMEKCREFAQKQIPVRWVILDDMWADIVWSEKLPKFTPLEETIKVMRASKMNDYEADPVRFPHGLRGCVSRLREEFGLRTGVWHPINGYWAGLLPGGKADEKLAGQTMTLPDGRIQPDLSDPGRAYAYYSKMYAFFRDCGVDFVKVDNQSSLREICRDQLPLGLAAENLCAGIEGGAGRYFDGAMINCMGMASENMFGRKTSAINRCSGDFLPENREWFACHVMQCAYNGLVQGQFYIDDWDMWWSDDEQAVKNSVLRALSGGPVYVSDRLGRSRPEVFKPLCFSDGRILRPDGTAVPTGDCLLSDMTVQDRPLKVFNTAGEQAYIAAFDLRADGGTVSGVLSPDEIPGLSGECFVLYEYFSGMHQVLGCGGKYVFELNGPDDFRLFSLTPIQDGTAIVGDASKFISGKAVLDAGRDFVRLREGGLFRMYSEHEIEGFEDREGKKLPFCKDNGLYTVDTAGTCEIYWKRTGIPYAG